MISALILSATLFGLRNPGDGGRQLVTIDPATAAVAPISASVDPPNGTPSGVIAMDRGGDRFFFTGTPGVETTPRLYTIDTNTGAVLSSPPIAAGTSVLGLEYDEVEDVLYGLRTPAGEGGKQVVIFDVATGTATAVSASITPPIGMPSGVTTMDEAGNRFFFIGTAGAETNQRIYTVDTATGALLSSPTVDAAFSVAGLEYDDADGILYALRTPLADGGKQVAVLDPATGTATAPGASIGPSLGIASGVTGLDGAGDRFFFVATPNSETDSRIYTVDTDTGALVSSPTIVGSAFQFLQGLAFEASGPPPTVTVTIDIWPGLFPNYVIPGAPGVIAVAIVTTPAFNAATVSASTVRFGPGNAPALFGIGLLIDVDHDGDKDMLLAFKNRSAAIPCGATSATLTGPAFSGTDSVKTIKCH